MESRYRDAEGQLDLFPLTPRKLRWRFFPYVIVGIVFVLLWLVSSTSAQEGFRDEAAHHDHHAIYNTLHNQRDTSCCHNGDCRPTIAKNENGQWYAKVDGIWTLMDASRFVKEYEYSWSETAHVCASPAYSANGPYVFCFVKPGAQG